MNSQRIKQKFGSYGVEVLQADADVRISSLFSEHDGGRITRTLALVAFVQPMPQSLADLHERIISGQSIGATFRSDGWNINKPLLAIEHLAPEADYEPLYHMMDLKEPQTLAIHMYRFQISKDDNRQPYATIVEIHSPAYLSDHEVNQIANETDSGKIDLPVPSLTEIQRRLQGLKVPDTHSH